MKEICNARNVSPPRILPSSSLVPLTNEIFVLRTRPCRLVSERERGLKLHKLADARASASGSQPGRAREGEGEGRTKEGAVIGIDRDFPRDKPRRIGHSYMGTE